MEIVSTSLQSSETPTAVSIRIRNLTHSTVTVIAPNPYLATWVLGTDRTPYLRSRAVAWNDSRKSAELPANGEVEAIIDIGHYWNDIHGDAIVTVRIQFLDSLGQPFEETVEGKAFLDIPSFEEKLAKLKEKLAEMRRSHSSHNVPSKLFDVSDSTHFNSATCSRVHSPSLTLK